MNVTNLVHVESNSLEALLHRLVARIDHVEESIPNHPMFTSLGERLAHVETNVFMSADDSSGTTKEPLTNAAMYHLLDDVRSHQMKIRLDHDVHISALQLELEKQKRAVAALPTTTDAELLKQSVMAEVARLTHHADTKMDQMELALQERLAHQVAMEAEWKAAFEAKTMERIDGIFNAIHDNTTMITNVVTVTENRIKVQQEAINVMEDAVAFLRERVSQIVESNVNMDKRLTSLEDSSAVTHAKLMVLRETVQEHDDANHTTFKSLAHGLQQLKTEVERQNTAHDALEKATTDKVTDLNDQTSTLSLRAEVHDRRLDALGSRASALESQEAETRETVGVHHASIESLRGQHAKATQLHAKLEAYVASMDKETRQRLDDGDKAFDGLNLECAHFRREVREATWAQGETNKMVAAEMKELMRSLHAAKEEIKDVAADLPKFHMELSHTNANVSNVRLEMRDIRGDHASSQEVLTALSNRLNDLKSHSNSQFERAKTLHEELEQGHSETTTVLERIVAKMDDEHTHTQNNLKELKKLLDGLQHVEHNDTTAVDKQLNALALAIAQVDLKQEHFRSHSTALPEDLKVEVAGHLLRAARLISGTIRCQLYARVLTDDQHLDETALLLALRLEFATNFAKKVRHFIDKLVPADDNKYVAIARDVFERRIRVCLEATLGRDASGGGAGLDSKAGKGRPNTATCISCDRPICEASPTDENQEYDVSHDATARKKTTAARNNTVDVKSVIPRRSGHTSVPPKTASDPVHVHPLAKDKYIYRGGFRLPKSGPANKPEMEANLAIQTIHLTTSDHPDACLEKVSLVGKHQDESTLLSWHMPRPHTAPHSKSLPKLPTTPIVND
ncbi:Aste57867_3529 [Aphanomyces stellatus]|uniref:Aste57867_3529 protein n=1 Tax=Aphanomyces stellatus TaxID=120398 RepID=A0A485KFD1_9STRA|nr:hypothetical protein As57867_003518 [Aphanomyces stellatus]VFT80692.1 Aste57867_3529 [Aphanomyces stellatus]